MQKMIKDLARVIAAVSEKECSCCESQIMWNLFTAEWICVQVWKVSSDITEPECNINSIELTPSGPMKTYNNCSD